MADGFGGWCDVGRDDGFGSGVEALACVHVDDGFGAGVEALAYTHVDMASAGVEALAATTEAQWCRAARCAEKATDVHGAGDQRARVVGWGENTAKWR